MLITVDWHTLAFMRADCQMSLLELNYIKTCFQLGTLALPQHFRGNGRLSLQKEFQVRQERDPILENKTKPVFLRHTGHTYLKPLTATYNQWFPFWITQISQSSHGDLSTPPRGDTLECHPKVESYTDNQMSQLPKCNPEKPKCHVVWWSPYGMHQVLGCWEE